MLLRCWSQFVYVLTHLHFNTSNPETRGRISSIFQAWKQMFVTNICNYLGIRFPFFIMTQTFINEEKKALPYRTKLNLSLDAMRLKETSKYLRLQFKLIKMVVSQLRSLLHLFCLEGNNCSGLVKFIPQIAHKFEAEN